MKDVTSKKAPKKSAYELELEAMKSEFETSQSRAKSGGTKRTFDTLNSGKNYRRILPRPGSPRYFVKGFKHYNVGPDKKHLRCLTTKFADDGSPSDTTECPVCQKFISERAKLNKKYEKGSAEGKAAYGKMSGMYRPRVRYVMAVYDPKAEELEIKVLDAGTQIWEQLQVFFFDTDECGDFTDPETGRTLIIDRKGSERDTEYNVRLANSGPQALDNWDELQESLPDLNAALGALYEPEKIQAIMDGTDTDEDEEEETHKKPSTKRRAEEDEDAYKPSKRFKGKGKDEEEDEETDEDGDDEPAPPKKPTKKPAPKEDESGEDEDEEEAPRPPKTKKKKAPVEEPEEKPAPKKAKKPGCFGNPDDHDPNDDVCRNCPFYDACAEEPEVASKLERLEAAKKASTKKDKLKKTAGK